MRDFFGPLSLETTLRCYDGVGPFAFYNYALEQHRGSQATKLSSEESVQKIAEKKLSSADLTTPSPEGSPRTHLEVESLEVENLVVQAEVVQNSWCGEVFIRIAAIAKQCFPV